MPLRLPQTPVIAPVRSLEDADRAIQGLLDYLERLRTGTMHDADGAAPIALLPFVDVRRFGAKGDGKHVDRQAFQDAIDHAANLGAGNLGAVVYVGPGRYMIDAPLILPRTGLTPTNVVHLIGADVRTSAIVGTPDFPANRAMIEWEAVAARAWHQRIANLDLVLPNVAGTMAIWYQPTDTSTLPAILAETLQIDLDTLLLEGSNTHHSRLVWLQGNVKVSTVRRVYGDCAAGDKTFDTVVLEVDSTPQSGSDGAGLILSRIEHLYGGLRRGGRHQTFKGRLHRVVWDTAFQNGSRGAPGYEFINSSANLLVNLSNEGTSEQPQVKFTGCQQNVVVNLGLGAPNEAEPGDGVGNGLELVDCQDNVFLGRSALSGTPSFSASGVKAITLDADSARNRFYNWYLNDSVANEVIDNGTDNYGEFYDITNGAWYFLGRERVGVQMSQEPIPTFTDGDTTPSVAGGTVFKTGNTTPTTITAFDNGIKGQRITLIFTDANTTVAETGNIRLSAAFTSSPDDTLELVYDGSAWYEVGRSVN